MNGAPDWQDGECCFRCRTQFTLVARKHHCRNCGNIFCAKCSSQQIPLPKLNIEKNVRVCDGCYEKIATKNEDPLALAIDKSSSDNNDSSSKTNKSSSLNSKSSSSSSKSTTSSNKPAGNASAPSEQELKEEEELQLALALSLSEAPAKISFPDCRQFEDSNAIAISSNSTGTSSSIINSNHDIKNNVASQQQTNQPTSAASDLPSYLSSTLESKQFSNTTGNNNSIQAQYPQELQPVQPLLDRDLEVFRFVAEVQSTSEVFTNRIKSNKLRNRPIATDSAIQSLFLKLTSMHAKLLEYIKIHDDERAGYETVQDKLSQIADARAALDALREEHQEKIRQEAAEAERQRQSQLALKLEMMRQKKSEMMQYQREIALQRIHEQEMMLRQPQGYQASNNNVSQQQTPQPTQQQAIQQQQQQNQPQPQPPMSEIQPPAPMQQHQPMAQQSMFQQHINGQQQHQQFIPQLQHQISDQPVPQSLPVAPPQPPKPDDEALLISFDD